VSFFFFSQRPFNDSKFLFFHTRAVYDEAILNIKPGVMSLMNATIGYQSFASSLAKNTQKPSNTRVSDDGMYITYADKTLSIVKWRIGLRKLADEVTEELDALCLHQTFGLDLDADVYDDWSNDHRGYSWTKNGKFIDDSRSLLAALLREQKSDLATIDEFGELRFKRSKVWEFINKCDVVNEKLSMLAFFTAGQTSRITEFVEHKFSNSTRPRTLFRDHETLWLAVRRLKTENILGKETFLPMKCYPELSKLLQRYLLVVRPVEAEFINILKGRKQYQVYMEYIWTKAGDALKPKQMYESITKFTTKYFGSSIGSQKYRQMCVAIGRVFIGSEYQLRLEEGFDVLASQAGHGLNMARTGYASEKDHHHGMPSDLLLRYGQVSEAWWEVTGLAPDTPAMVPLFVRQGLRKCTQWPLGHEALVAHAAPAPTPAFDPEAFVHALTASMAAQLEGFKASLLKDMHAAVAQGFSDIQYGHVDHLNPELPRMPSTPPPGRSFSDHDIADATMESPPAPPATLNQHNASPHQERLLSMASQSSEPFSVRAAPSLQVSPGEHILSLATSSLTQTQISYGDPNLKSGSGLPSLSKGKMVVDKDSAAPSLFHSSNK